MDTVPHVAAHLSPGLGDTEHTWTHAPETLFWLRHPQEALSVWQ